ncbi:MAG: zinc ribbon domain-containing protein, partial [Pseudomonadales bacterium]|nr:zinc ribbon domain-containing protein [Pseudomonadales bacterium]
MNDIKRPVPRSDEYDTREFWAASKEKELRYQQCKNCNTVVFYPRRHCTGCTDGKLTWKKSEGKGAVYTF